MVEQYLLKMRRLEELRQEVRTHVDDLKETEREVMKELEHLPGRRYQLMFTEDQEKVFGRQGALHVDLVRRKEYMSRDTLEQHLLTFYQQKFPEQSEESVKSFAHETAEAVWNDRPYVETVALKRSIARRKRQKMDCEEAAFDEHL